MSKIKILISTFSAGLHSGLSETTRNIFIPLLEKYKDKYEIHQLGYHHFGPMKEPVPWPIYPTKVVQGPQGLMPDHEDQYGQKSFDEIVAKLNPDICFGYGDMWHFDHMLHSPLRNTYRLLTYYTIDGQPYYGHLNADMSTDWGNKLSKADQIVVLSHFGKEVLQRGNKELADKDIKVMYHPLDMRRYPVLNTEQRDKIRLKLIPKNLSNDIFLCGWLGKNQFRKQNHKLWEIAHYIIYGDYIECLDCKEITVKEWNHSTRQSKDPDKYIGELDKITLYDESYRYQHCWYCKSKNIVPGVPNDKFYMWFHMGKDEPGYNADLHERMWNLQNKCLFTNNLRGLSGIKQQDVALILGAWDCMLYPSGGEGFSNPSAECMAAGTPIVYSNYSSHAEFSKFGGLRVRCSYQPEIIHGIQRAVVDTGHAVKQLLYLIRNPDERKKLGLRGRSHISQFNIPHMVDSWDNILTDMMKNPVPINSQKIYSTVI